MSLPPERFPYVARDAALGWASLAPIRQSDLPVLLGQVNFFMAFDVCLLCSRATFEVRPAP